MNTLNDLGAKIQFIDNGFSDAERQTDVRVALIYIDIPEPEHHSEIYEKFQKAKEYRESTGDNSSKLTTTNFLEDLIAQYNEEMELGLALIDEFNALLPYLNRNVVGDAGNYSNLSLKVGNEAVGYTCSPKNKFINLTRHKYWTSLLNNEKFIGMLTKNLKDKYSSMISKFAEYDFTMFNIQTLMNDMNSGLQDGIEKTILDLFDKMSAKFAYIPESEIRGYENTGSCPELIIDVGINYGTDGKQYGDVSEELRSDKYNQCFDITPRIGGVGLMTRAMLMCNTAHVFTK